MFCPHCGSEFEKRGDFCPLCGYDLRPHFAEPPEPEPVPAPEPEWDREPEREEALPEETLPEEREPEPEARPESRRRERGSRDRGHKRWRRKRLLLCVLLVVLLAALAAAVVLLVRHETGTHRRSSGTAVVYSTQGGYGLRTDLEQGEGFLFVDPEENASSSVSADSAVFSPDGVWLYYFTQYDHFAKAGSLYRVQWAALTDDPEANRERVEKIADQVRSGYQVLEDGTVLYQDTSNTLYYDSGEERIRIASGVNAYYTDGAQRVVYAVGNASEGRKLYGVSLDDPYVKQTLISSYRTLYTPEDLNHIFYTKSSSGGGLSLYVTGYDGTSQKLASNVTVLAVSDGIAYYTVENGTLVSLYKYVEDEYAREDAGITDPTLQDYGTFAEYNEAKRRISLREELQADENNLVLRSLYCYDHGQVTEVCDSVVSATYYDGGEHIDALTPVVLYYDADRLTQCMSMSEVLEAKDIAVVQNQFYYHLAAACFVPWGSTRPICPEGDLLEVIEPYFDGYDFSDGTLHEHTDYFVFGSTLYLEDCVYGDVPEERWYYLFEAQISDQSVAAFTSVPFTQGGKIVGASGESLYCAVNLSSDEEGTMTGSLYRLETAGGDVLLGQDLDLGTLQYYEDGTVLVLSGTGAQLTLLSPDGTAAQVGEDVTLWCRMDETNLLYLSQGDLYLFRDGGRTLVQEDVDWFWTSERLEYTQFAF